MSGRPVWRGHSAESKVANGAWTLLLAVMAGMLALSGCPAKNTVKRKHGNQDCATYGDLRQLLAEGDHIDAVLIAPAAAGTHWLR